MKNKSLKHYIFLMVVGGLIAPIFFQLTGNIFNTGINTRLDDSGGILLQVPLPISIVFCVLGAVYFWTYLFRYKAVIITTLGFLFLLILSMSIAGVSRSKAILLLQNILPTMGLFLGISLATWNRKLIAMVALYFLMLFITVHLIATWMQGQLALTHHLYYFSVYQHYQYVPLVMIGLFLWCWVELRHTHARKILYLTPLIAIYAAAGNSILALFGLILFSLIFSYFSRRKKIDFLIPIMIFISVGGYFYVNSLIAPQIQINNELAGLEPRAIFGGKLFTNDGRWLYGKSDAKVPINITQRVELKSLYFDKLGKNTLTVIFGNAALIDREITSSAHNYYLDLAYNFGVISCIPILFLFLFTTLKVYQARNFDENIVWLFAVVFYFVIVDSTFKVTLRQPYPGIISFFLWGILLTICTNIKYDEKT
jgi:hypothetical protein